MESGAVQHYMLDCFLAPSAEAGRGLEAGYSAGVEEAGQADLPCADLGEQATLRLWEAGV